MNGLQLIFIKAFAIVWATGFLSLGFSRYITYLVKNWKTLTPVRKWLYLSLLSMMVLACLGAFQ